MSNDIFILIFVLLLINHINICKMKTSNEIKPIPAELQKTLREAATELIYAINRETNKEKPDFTIITRMVKAAKLLPVYLPELQKYF